MKHMTSAEIRKAFLDFFAKNGHEVVASSSLVPGNDPTLLFTNAGMVQFKDVFLGMDQRPYQRATTSQKCMRISGKHNDLENVGPSPRHHTFFEMLGNFSFGDYFKRDAIKLAYQLMTQVYGLPPERLAFTVYRDDDEAYNIWVNEVGVDPKRVARMGPKTNFWQMAETGPCGPTSEIHWDNDPARGEDSIIADLTAEDNRFLELWNLVFMQYNRLQADPQHTGQFDQPLPAPGVDTGMGLERIAAVIQEAAANYDTDLFSEIMDATQEILHHDDETRDKHFVAYRVIADHTRAASFLIADGVTPGPTDRRYIVRMLIRRALRFAHKMDVDQAFLSHVAEVVVNKMGGQYPELVQFHKSITYQITAEEERFRKVLVSALKILDEMIERLNKDGITELSGHDAFRLSATHGLPMEITRDILKERGLSVDEAGFFEAMEAHKLLSGDDDDDTIDVHKSYQKVLADLRSQGSFDRVDYNPYSYDQLTFSAPVVAIFRDGESVSSADKGDQVEIVLQRTSFYVASGGQISDTGILTGKDLKVQVEDVRQPVGGLIVHVGKVTSGRLKVGDNVQAQVDVQRRWDIMRNHTATHLLHAALHRVLGEHARQQGSLVAPDRLRFDFSHDKRLTQDELNRITDEVNAMVLANEPILIVEKSRDEAMREGAMALFGEKYGATVRTVTVCSPDTRCEDRFSYELCGGTHIRSTAEIGPFIIVGEGSVSSGVRRIEAITGRAANQAIVEQRSLLTAVAAQLDAKPEGILPKVEHLVSELEQAHKSLDKLKRDSAKGSLESLVNNSQEVDGVRVVASQVAAGDPDLLGQMADWVRDRLQSGVVVLGSEIEGKVSLVAKVTPDIQARGLHAGKLVGEVAKLVGGGGGGRPDFATAGGKNPEQLPDALAQVPTLVAERLK